MWKVTNKKNEIVLIQFEKEIIKPFFKILYEAISGIEQNKLTLLTKNIWEHCKTYKNMGEQQKKIFDYIMKNKYNNISFSDLVYSLINSLSSSDIIKYYKIYLYQNLKARKLNYDSILDSPVPRELQTVFSKFFYDKFLSAKKPVLKI